MAVGSKLATMTRRDRRYVGGPHFPLERVRVCVQLRQFYLTRSANKDAQRALPAGTVAVEETVREIILSLQPDQWAFAQEKQGQWVDVYRVSHEGADLWVKLKVELTPHTKEQTVVVSFHEWDDARPI